MWQEKEQELEQSPVKDPKIVDLEPELPGKNDRIAVLYTLKLTKQDQMSNRYDTILQWIWMEKWLLTDSLQYPQSRDAITYKKISQNWLVSFHLTLIHIPH